MEKLVKESDGLFRTASACCAVIPKIASGSFEIPGTDKRTNWFEFKASVLGQVTRVEWPAGAPFAIFDGETAASMLRAGYASNISDALADAYNEAVDAEPEIPEPPSDDTGSQSDTGSQQGSSPSEGTPNAGDGTNGQQGDPSSTPAPDADQSDPAKSGTGSDPTFPPEGWAAHPTAPGYFYKDQEVLTEADLLARIGA